LGHGPDTFALYFPNQDPYRIYTMLFIDKPHNMYLQFWLNLGGVATLAFLAMVILHCIRTFRILRQSHPTGELYVLSLGLFAGWFAYLLAAFFYDSAVSVAPTFWIMFGLSMAMNEALVTGTLPERRHTAIRQDQRRNFL
jgi:O-antigen ligase